MNTIQIQIQCSGSGLFSFFFGSAEAQPLLGMYYLLLLLLFIIINYYYYYYYLLFIIYYYY